MSARIAPKDAAWRTSGTDALARALLAVKTPDEMRRFLRDLLTEGEIVEFGKRWQAACMLADGVPYLEIVAATGLSSATVARVQQWRLRGEGGYRRILERTHHGHHRHTPRSSRAAGRA